MQKPANDEAPVMGLAGLKRSESLLVNILALTLVRGEKQADQIGTLGRAGFRAAEIADLLGTTRNTVSVELSRQRSAKKAKPATRKKKK